MTQNRSTAVMARRVEAHDSLDYFPTPPWATRALCEHVLNAWPLAEQTVWEPACGEGHMSRPLAEYFGRVRSSDVHSYGSGEVHDFLLPTVEPVVDWVITNPPFRLAEQFIDRAFQVASQGVAVLVRTSFLEGIGRHDRLFSQRKPRLIAQFCERVPMVKGRLDEEAASATAYCWIVWAKWTDAPSFVWIPACRSKLERPADYQEAAA